MISCELDSKINKFLVAEIDIRQLEEWLVPMLPVYLKDPNSADANIIATIELELAELNNGLRNEGEIRQNLIQLLIGFIPTWAIPEINIIKSSSNQNIRADLNWNPIPYSSISLVEGAQIQSSGI